VRETVEIGGVQLEKGGIGGLDRQDFSSEKIIGETGKKRPCKRKLWFVKHEKRVEPREKNYACNKGCTVEVKKSEVGGSKGRPVRWPKD